MNQTNETNPRSREDIQTEHKADIAAEAGKWANWAQPGFERSTETIADGPFDTLQPIDVARKELKLSFQQNGATTAPVAERHDVPQTPADRPVTATIPSEAPISPEMGAAQAAAAMPEHAPVSVPH